MRPNKRLDDIEPENIIDDEPVGISATCLWWAFGLAFVLWLMIWAVVVFIADVIERYV